jgi:GNAT superfamily N-acetyltransferase
MTLEISHPNAGELEETLRLAFAHLPEHLLAIRINAILEQYRSGNLATDGIFQACQNGKRVGVLFSQLRLDGVVMAWVPIMTDDFSTDAFFKPLDDFCRKNQAIAALILADNGQKFDEQTLLSNGKFELLSDLVNLVIPVTEAEPEEESNKKSNQKSEGEFQHLRFLPMSESPPESFELMTNLVQATYQNTKDFPRLMQMTPANRVLQGYLSAAEFLPQLWFFVQKEGQNIGALLMTDQPEEQMELTYMGLTEDARGFGFAKEIIRYAKRIACQQRRAFLVTSVDERNSAALKAYLSQGFTAWDRKTIYAKFPKQN